MTEPRTIAPHLITDTGVWRLVVDISDRALHAWIRRNDDPDEPMFSLAHTYWTGDDSLRNVENAVYDHPLVLDDFEADILVSTPKYILIPAEAASDTLICRNAFEKIYGGSTDDDIFIDTIGSYACVYMLMPGLRPFLARTFAGSRISCHVTPLLRHWMTVAPEEGKTVFADIRNDSADIAVFDGRNLLNVSCRRWSVPDDLLYFIANACTVYHDASPADVPVYISGDTSAVREMLTPYFADVSDTPLPAADCVPLAALLCSYRKSK